MTPPSRNFSRTSMAFITFMAMTNLGFFVFQSYYIIFLKNSGLTFTDISVIFFANFIALALLNFPSGNFADKYGRKKAVIIGTLISGLGMIVYGLTSLLLVFLAMEIVLALASSLQIGALEAWYIDAVRAEKRESEAERTFSLTQGISYFLGLLAGIIGSILAVFFLSLPMVVGGIIVLFTTAIVVIGFRENFGDVSSGFRSHVGESLRHFRESPALKRLTAGEMLRTAASIVYFIIYQPYLVAIGLGEQYLGLFFSCLMVASAVGSLISVRMVRFSQRYLVLMAMSGLLLTAYVLQPFTHDMILSAFLFTLCGFANGVAIPAIMVWRNELIPSRIRASSLAVLSTLLNTGNALMTLVLGPVADGTSMQVALVLGAVLAGCAMPFYYLAHRKERAARSDAALAQAK